MHSKSFRTVLKPEYLDLIDHTKKIMMMGSCFSEHIGEKLIARKFNVNLNPFGILFHPLAISVALDRMIKNKPFSSKDLKFEDNRYLSFYHHGKFNHTDQKIILSNINDAFKKGRKQLITADYLFITWGTAFGYAHKESGNNIVSNCHKIPSNQFNKILSRPDEIVQEYQNLIDRLIDLNPNLKIIITVSPVKHLKDGLINNNISKSVLLLAAHRLKTETKGVSYFPAYELVQDDLRDYRFYAKDMAHPSVDAVEYVWDFFKKTYWNNSTLELDKKIESILTALQHRPLHPENEAHQSFVDTIKKDAEALKSNYSFLDFEKELKSI
jgi:hypothetical protein